MDMREVPDSMKMPPKIQVNDLPEVLEQAGHSFKDAIIKLGLSVEGILWVNMIESKKFEMWIVWSGLDAYGPLAIAKSLFRAYNAAALPQVIDPFDITVVGPEHIVSRLHAAFSKKSNIEAPDLAEYAALYLQEGENKTVFCAVKRSWILLPVKRRLPKKEIDRGWRRFQDNVDKLAA
ncbi:hypothetical protein [Methylobacterium sp. WL6]|uniref:hypothetical protein n=1 Tax=Methylobacterium sp. WL6 TaxID=2603901 RepID=UPI0011C9AB58|nr:hypothetical protein [Methylobacterium sp. WL6]TXN72403.1 hypothetical protein FV230_05090 [Methylobacterium sp. WL6]